MNLHLCFFYDYTEYTINANNKQDIKFHSVPWVVLLNEWWWVAGEGAEGWVEREDFIRPPPLLDKTFQHNTAAKGKRFAVFS